MPATPEGKGRKRCGLCYLGMTPQESRDVARCEQGVDSVEHAGVCREGKVLLFILTFLGQLHQWQSKVRDA